MRRSLINLRSAKGRGWYKQYLEEGPESFLKNSPLASFDWSEGNIIRPKVFIDMKLEEESMGRIEIELASDIVPNTVTNFLNLILGKGPKGYCYKGSKVHDIIPNNTVRLGDVETTTGNRSHSSYSTRYFPDENFIIPHTARGIVSMVAPGVHSNGSQFYITLSPKTTHLNGRAVGFGRIIKGDNVLKEIEKIYTYRGVPARDITIGNCGIIPVQGISDITIYPEKKFSMSFAQTNA